MLANQLAYKLRRRNDVKITLIEPEKVHYYQPGFLFIPLGLMDPKEVVMPRALLISEGVKWLPERAVKITGLWSLVRTLKDPDVQKGISLFVVTVKMLGGHKIAGRVTSFFSLCTRYILPFRRLR